MQPVMKAYLTNGRCLSCTNSTISKQSQWDIGTLKYVNSDHKRFFIYILYRMSPRSSLNKPPVAHWIDTWIHLLVEYRQKIASLFLEIATDFQYSEILFWIFLRTGMYSPKRMFYWEPVDTLSSFISSTCVKLPKFLSRYVPYMCACVHMHMCVCIKTTTCEQSSKKRLTNRLIIHIKPSVGC